MNLSYNFAFLYREKLVPQHFIYTASMDLRRIILSDISDRYYWCRAPDCV